MLKALNELEVASLNWKFDEIELKPFSPEKMSRLAQLAPHIASQVLRDIAVGVHPESGVITGKGWVDDSVKAFVNLRPNNSHFDGILVALILDAIAVASWSAQYVVDYGVISRILSVGGIELWKREARFSGGHATAIRGFSKAVIVDDLRVDWQYYPDEGVAGKFPWNGGYRLRLVGTTPDHPKRKEWTLYLRQGAYFTQVGEDKAELEEKHKR